MSSSSSSSLLSSSTTTTTTHLKDDNNNSCITITAKKEQQTSPSSSSPIVCHGCGKPPYIKNKPMLRCSRCQSAYYHDRKCQKKHYPRHKLTCRLVDVEGRSRHQSSFSSLPLSSSSSTTTTPKTVPPKNNNNNNIVNLQVQDTKTNEWKNLGQVALLNNNNNNNNDDDYNDIPKNVPPKPPPPPSKHESKLKTLPPSLTNHILPHPSTYTYHHSPDSIDTNLLLFLHGAGDTHHPFATLARTMSLPQTASLSINAAAFGIRLPFDLGYNWFHECDYYDTGLVLEVDDPRRKESLKRVGDVLLKMVTILAGRWGGMERLFLFGFSSGACLAMEVAMRLVGEGKGGPLLGGVICVAGGVKNKQQQQHQPIRSSSSSRRSDDVVASPVLIIAGSCDEIFPPYMAHDAAVIYNRRAAVGCCPPKNETTMNRKKNDYATVFVKEGKTHGMVSSPEEMHRIMTFLAKRLVRRMMTMEEMAGL